MKKERLDIKAAKYIQKLCDVAKELDKLELEFYIKIENKTYLNKKEN